MEIIPVNFTEKTERTPAGTAAVQEKAADREKFCKGLRRVSE